MAITKPKRSDRNNSLKSGKLQESEQSPNRSVRMEVGKKHLILRIVMLSIMVSITIVNIYVGLTIANQFVIYSTVMLVHFTMVLAVGWFYFKNPAKNRAGNNLVSIIIPIYNQKKMIEIVIDSIYRSSYSNMEVIAINDGSNDGTAEKLDLLSKKYSNLKVIKKKNGGKRKAVATGFYSSSGKYVIIVDSDSVLTKTAVEEIVKAFDTDPEIGGVAGHVKLWNAEKNFLTKMQDTWYDYSYNILRRTESVFGNVMCCPGCLSGYRREAIEHFMPLWGESKNQSDDGMLASYNYAPVKTKFSLLKSSLQEDSMSGVSESLLRSGAKFDDAEDRLMTAQILPKWKSVYVPNALCYTEVPETVPKFIRQMLRWKKGYLRTSLFVSSFFWRNSNHFLMRLIYYIELLTMFTAPLIMITVFLYEPLVLNNFSLPLFFLAGILASGLVQGLDYRCRDKNSRYWMYQLPMSLFSSLVLTFLLIPALLLIRRNNWLTR